MTKRMLIDATQPEETRVAVVENDRLDSYDFDSAVRKQIKGNIFLAKVTRVEPSLQACFVEYGGNRQGFLAFTEIHPDYYSIPVEDRQALLAEEAAWGDDEDEDDDDTEAGDGIGGSSETGGGNPDAVNNDEENRGEDALYDKPPADMALVQPQSERVQGEVIDPEAIMPLLDAHEEHDDMPPAANVTEVARDNTVDSVGGEDAPQEAASAGRSRRMGQLRRKYKIQEVIKRRRIMLVQATKEERGGKGAAMTTYISLPGRYCVLMPNSPRGGGVSRKITDPQARRKMKDLLSELSVPNGMSVILRTAGMTRTRMEVKKDLEYLLRLWDEIRRETMQSEAPAMVYEEADIFKRVIRDLYSGETQEVIVSGGEGFKRVKQFMRQMVPAHAKKVYFYRDPLIPLFQRFNVESQIADIFNPRVELKSGGYIIINPTEALVSIDVNSGRATRERHIDDTALKTNIEAAEEVARQLRLRDLGGLVVIDFIDMESGRHNAKVERKLREAMAEDRARIEIGRISGFGLLELSRQRLHPSLTETHFEPCAHCGATGIVRTTESAAIVVMRAIEAEAVKGRSVAITANVPQAVAIYLLNHKREDINRIEEYFGCRVSLRADDNMMPNDVQITTEKGTPVPRQKVEMLPVPQLEGSDDDYLIADDEDDGEPLMVNPMGSDEDGAEVQGRPNSRRRRTGGRERNGRKDERRSSRGGRGEQGEGETRIDIAITEGAPDANAQPDDSGLARNDANDITPLPGEVNAQGKPRSRRGRNPQRRRRGERGGDAQAAGAGEAQGNIDGEAPQMPPVEMTRAVDDDAPKRKPRTSESVTAMPTPETPATDTKPRKKGWWQALID